MKLVKKLEGLPQVRRLADLCQTTSGFGGKSTLITEERKNKRQIRTMKGDNIGRFEIRKTYWFDFCRENITGRTTDRTKLGSIPKILLRKTGDSIIATYDESGIFPEQSLYFLFNNRSDLSFKFILGVLNSKLLNAFFRANCLTNKDSIAQVKKVDLDALPIPVYGDSNPVSKARHDRLVGLVDKMLALTPKLRAAKADAERQTLQNAVTATDQQINALVYELYGLTQDEIKLVEGIP
ncbi:MAG: TaqI-like C-terminal specificity domain-containing protein [Candidatus Aminicenantales bacterium]